MTRLMMIAALFLSITIPQHAAAEGVVRYEITGVVKALPGAGRARNEVLIAHDPIPEYRDLSGKVVGMEAMTMPFYLDSAVSLEGIKVGDRVFFVVESRTKPVFSEKVVSLIPLATREK